MYKNQPCEMLINHKVSNDIWDRLQHMHVSISLFLMTAATALLFLIFFVPALGDVKDIMLAGVFMVIFALGLNELRCSYYESEQKV